MTKQVIAKPKPIDLKPSSNNPKQTLASSGLVRIHLAFKKTAISISVASPLAIILQCAMPQSCGKSLFNLADPKRLHLYFCMPHH